ncbi:MAG: hypothetical protein ACE362_25120 [Phaeodactylibacter xiamenensis]|uniref:Uncharacterized protein n=1 Tax=Phaeodactylibacter xiamenensis TaxID=1524460 RepID=A0A098S3J0_9BACT|nr:hypothetical protein [Phaeodactylibacter xiamenensis]KGE86616.1 hypothetical protein IX84_20200 [Phaeodactylibacter xiamenensis]MCR9053989.1 hypothetical protein [bacterium]
MFEQIIHKEIENNQDVKFFLATDDSQVKAYLIKKFPGAIHTNDFELNRTTRKGIENAVIDLYMLSKTEKIYASHGSSFSETAFHMGETKLEILKTN